MAEDIVRRSGTTFTVTDGPFTESKEWIAGFDIVDCADLDEAIDYASRHPMARHGRIDALSRQGEAALLRPELEARFSQVLELPLGFADGGDVLDLGERMLIGLSARTDRAGAEALAALLAGLGRKAEVVAPPAGVLHLKTGGSLVAEGVVLATAALAATGRFAGCEVIEVPAGEEGGANVLRVGDTLLVGAHYPQIAARLAGLGAEVVPLANREIARIDAGFTCMSLRW